MEIDQVIFPVVEMELFRSGLGLNTIYIARVIYDGLISFMNNVSSTFSCSKPYSSGT